MVLIKSQAKERHVQCVRAAADHKKPFDGALARAFYSDHLKGAGWVRLFQIIINDGPSECMRSLIKYFLSALSLSACTMRENPLKLPCYYIYYTIAPRHTQTHSLCAGQIE